MTALTERTGTPTPLCASADARDGEGGGPRWLLAEQLDRGLGDPEADGPLSYARAAHQDAAEEFPADACELLGALGVHHYYIPAEHGGALTGFPQLLEIVRTLARRDLTCAIGHGKTFLGAVCVWVAEDRAGAGRLAPLVRAGEPVSLGLTERTHGSDLMAGEVVAERTDGGYLVSGEKWLINNATRSRLVCLLARTSPEGGPRGFSLLLVDKNELPEGVCRTLPKVRTLGIRGADISGIAFDRAPVDADALVGREGQGPETVLKALQITRSLCAGLSLGAMDHGLRLACRFAAERELYGRRLIDLPATRRTLAESYADLLAMEALSTVAARSVHTLPDELSVTSAVAKYLAPTVADDILARLRGVLGARSYLSRHYAHGRFQKLERDHRIVGIFDGNTMVNLYALTAQFRTLARRHPVRTGSREERQALAAAFGHTRPLPRLRPGRLSLVARNGSSLMGSLPTAAEVLAAQASREPALAPAAALARTLAAAAAELHTRMRAQRPVPGGAPVESFDLARGYSLLFAAACCLGVWQHNRRETLHTRTEALWRDGLWLHAALARLAERLDQAAPGLTGPQPGRPFAYDPELAELYERLLDRLADQYQAGELFSLLTGRIAEGPPKGPPC
ncbi:acyl-CoA dehydrogenase family protein [Streptomyces sp. MUM 178J]|uniref:acyl-CoA dehydrogenase family protein n=1 Tax=Streptomyces sp. MUM 178J TaxID=2791991 RepID=UPI001F043FF7|nr:acyl-CoA dehydrogenase family protein [Streptomyces sp. MUM 178J]WRQ80171.1 acyl-CoA dehydrogenase family protein [Streptomyces sp. MUM 178J]